MVIEENQKTKESENVAYILFSQYYSAVIALRVLKSVPEKDRIVDAKVCYTDHSIIEQETMMPTLEHLDDS
jgi:hypothetical protein